MCSPLFISPLGFSRQAYVMLLLLSFLFFCHLFNDRLEQRDLGNYKTDLHQVFRDGRHAGVDVQSGTGFPIDQGTLRWQPILGAISAAIGDTPSFLRLVFHNGWQEPLNGFAPNSHGRRVWSFARTSLNVKVKGQRSKVEDTRDKKRAVHSEHPQQCERDGTPSLQRRASSRSPDSIAAEGVFAVMRALGLAGYRWALPRISSYCNMPTICTCLKVYDC